MKRNLDGENNNGKSIWIRSDPIRFLDGFDGIRTHVDNSSRANALSNESMAAVDAFLQISLKLHDH